MTSLETGPDEAIDLSDLLAEPPHRFTETGRQIANVPPGIKRVSHTHEAIMDYMLANPAVPLGEVAAHFGYTQPWLSTLIHSDTFQQAYKARRKAYEALHDTSLVARLHSLTHKAMDVIEAQLDSDEPSAKLAGDTLKTALTSLGLGARREAPAAVENHFHIEADDVRIAQQILQGR